LLLYPCRSEKGIEPSKARFALVKQDSESVSGVSRSFLQDIWEFLRGNVLMAMSRRAQRGGGGKTAMEQPTQQHESGQDNSTSPTSVRDASRACEKWQSLRPELLDRVLEAEAVS
jgi:hypothetical protein